MQLPNKTSDPDGLATLEAFAGADRFNAWMYSVIAASCRGRVLEIGSGIGNISQFFLQNGQTIALTDFREEYCAQLQQRFSGQSNLLGISQMDLAHPQFRLVYQAHINQYDTVFSLNVVEHIEEDDLALRNASQLLRKGGKLITLVPAHAWLFNQIDEKLGHYRRYTKKSLRELIVSVGLQPVKLRYFNAMAIPGWWFAGRSRNKEISKGAMRWYNRLVPVFKLIDVMLFYRVGISVIAVAEKN